MAQPREIADRYTDLVNARDADAIGELFADDAVMSDPSGVFEGREAIVQYWAGFFRAFPDATSDDETKAESGDTAITEWSLTGTNSGPMETPEGPLQASGNRMTIRGCDAITVRNARIQSHRVYFDQLAVMTQLGLIPEGAAPSS